MSKIKEFADKTKINWDAFCPTSKKRAGSLAWPYY